MYQTHNPHLEAGIPLGTDESGAEVRLNVQKYPNLFIVGKANPGMTVLFNNIINYIVMNSAPVDAGIVLVSWSQRALTDSPHLLIPRGDDHKSIWDALDYVNKLYLARKELKEVPESVVWKQVFLLCEEFDALHNSWFNGIDIINRITDDGGKLGIHIIVMTMNQHLNASSPSRVVFALSRPTESKAYLKTPLASKLEYQDEAYFLPEIGGEVVRLRIENAQHILIPEKRKRMTRVEFESLENKKS